MVNDSKEILKYVKPDTDVVAVDEVQFFDHDIVDVCEYLADRGSVSYTHLDVYKRQVERF